jgi:hypothetical protein
MYASNVASLTGKAGSEKKGALCIKEIGILRVPVLKLLKPWIQNSASLNNAKLAG